MAAKYSRGEELLFGVASQSMKKVQNVQGLDQV